MTHLTSPTRPRRTQTLPVRAVTSHGLFRPQYLVGWFLLAMIASLAVLAPIVTSQDPTLQDLTRRLTGPLSPNHPLGTDQLGRDVFSRLLHGARVSLGVSLISTLVATLIGGALGLLAGFREGKVGTLVMGVADAQLAFPSILLAIVFTATLGASVVGVTVVLALTNWVVFTRTVYGMVLSLKNREFVQASRSIGARESRLMLRHIPPHVLPTITVLANLQVGRMVLFESALSFLGLGVPADTPTWGAMLSDARSYLQTAPWLSIAPGLAIVALVVAVSLISDSVEEFLNPRNRGLA